MQDDLTIRTTVLPGGRIEIVNPDLEAGEEVDIYITPVPPPSARSAWEIISDESRRTLFKSAKEIDDYISEERESWDR